MTNKIRTRNLEPLDMTDGLLVKGKLLDGFDGAKTIAFKRKPTDTVPTILDDWLHEVEEKGLGGGTAGAATESTAGAVKFASVDEVKTGTVTNKAVTPAGVKGVVDLLLAQGLPKSTQTTAGITRYASDAEAYDGTVTDAAVTPHGMKAALDIAIGAIVNAMTPPSPPTLVGASTVVIGLVYQLQLSSIPTYASANITAFNVSVNGGTPSIVTANANSAFFNWTSTGTVGGEVFFTVTAVDSNNKISVVSTKRITLSTVTIETPSFVSPTNGALNIPFATVFTITDFAAIGGTATYLNTDWEIRTSSGGGGTVAWSELASTTNRTTRPGNWSTYLQPSTQYWVRARHRSSNFGASAWTEVSFTTVVAPTIPVITAPASVAKGTSVSLQLQSTPATSATIVKFNVTVNGGGVIPVTATSNAATYNWSSAGATGNTVVFAITAVDSNGMSSAVKTVTVALSDVQIATPTFTSPSANAVGITTGYSFVSSDFAVVGGSDTCINVDWELLSETGTSLWSSMADAVNKVSMAFPAGFLPSTKYTMRVRHRGTTYGVSNWAAVAFTTAAAAAGPTLTGSSAFKAGADYTLQFSATPVSPATSIASFTVTVNTSPPTTAVVTGGTGSYIFPAAASAALPAGATLTFSVTSKDNLNAISSASTKTIVVAKPDTPSFLTPTANETNVSPTVNFSCSDFSVTGGTSRQMTSDWEWRLSAAGSPVLYSSYNDALNLTDFTLPSGTLDAAKSYKVYVRYNSADFGYSNWAEQTFTTVAAPVAPTVGGADNVWRGDTYILPMSAASASSGIGILFFRVAIDGGAPVDVPAIYNNGVYTADFTWPGTETVNKATRSTANIVVTYKDDTGLFSAPSTKLVTIPSDYFDPPLILSPVNASLGVGTSLVVTIASPIRHGVGDHVFTNWKITEVGTGTVVSEVLNSTTSLLSWTCPVALAQNTEYSLQVQCNNIWADVTGWTTITFTTVAGGVPVFSSPLNGSKLTTNTPIFAVTLPTMSPGVSVDYCDWEVRTATGGVGTLLASTYADAVNKATWASGISLPSETNFFARMRCHNNAPVRAGVVPVPDNWSAWAEVSFVTPFVPAIVSPSAGALNTSPNLAIVSNTSTVPSNAQVSATHQISTDVGFVTIVASDVDSVATKTTWVPTGLLGNTQYYVRVKYKFADGTYTSWSNTVTFTTAVLPGSTWTSVVPTLAGVGKHLSIASDDCGTWVICGYDGVTFTKGSIIVSHDDGLTWARSEPAEQSVSDTIGTCHTVRWIGDRFILGAVDFTSSVWGNRIYQSKTGDYWNIAYTSTSSNTSATYDFVTDGAVIVGCGLSLSKNPVSLDQGLTFSMVAHGITSLSSGTASTHFKKGVYSPTLDLFVIMNESQTLPTFYWSTTGQAPWTTVTGPSTVYGLVDIAEGNGILLAAGGSVSFGATTYTPSNLLKSTTGKSWTKIASIPGVGPVFALNFIAGYFFACCQHLTDATKSVIARSADGITWVTYQITASAKFDIAEGNGNIIAAGCGATFTGATTGAATHGIAKSLSYKKASVTGPNYYALSGFVAAGSAHDITLTGTDVPGDSVVSFDLSVNGATPINLLANTSRQAGYSLSAAVTAGKAVGSVIAYTAVTKYRSGAVSQVSKKVIVISGVQLPCIGVPTLNATSFSLTGTISVLAFTPIGTAGTHLNTDWEIRTLPAGAGVLKYSLMASTTSKLTLTVPSGKLSNSTVYYIRTRHRDSNGLVSDWSEVKFTTVAVAVATGPTYSGYWDYPGTGSTATLHVYWVNVNGDPATITYGYSVTDQMTGTVTDSGIGSAGGHTVGAADDYTEVFIVSLGSGSVTVSVYGSGTNTFSGSIPSLTFVA